MIEFIAQLWDTAFNFEDFSRGERKFAFAQLMFIMIGVFGVVGFIFRIIMRVSGRKHHASAQSRLMDEMAAKARPGATRAEIAQMAHAEREARRAAARYIPPVPVALATRPDDGSYFVTLCAFAAAKQADGLMLNHYEKDALSVLCVAYETLGPAGLARLDDYDGVAPVRSLDLSRVFQQIGLNEFVAPFEKAIAVHLDRHQMIQDFVASGMPLEQAKASYKLPSYMPINESLLLLGGQARLVHLADRYYQAAYPWQEKIEKPAFA
ncbi:hypothetical protein BC777_0369 [Yoonia maricola]|uniref:DUF4375 domain-containing protein n=1 Tax=Yoonia maricola TaxID=420999 RepID=A0A2M8WKU9_9RHOB|nr:hypothetical protein [Yoonia maricola]PJI91538.1 hypothetical protein BC777_0369 [Yoonia maricola]